MNKNRVNPPNDRAPFKIQTTEISTNGTDKSLNTKCSNIDNPTKPQQSIYPPEILM
jgi:hypothetical protein